MCCNDSDATELGGWASDEPVIATAPTDGAAASLGGDDGGSHFGVHSTSTLMLLILLGVGLGLYLRNQKIL